jgi:hypothetical protein
MPGTFDPYHTWLGIPPEERPAHHYRLLGLKAFEGNLDVIEHAADQKMMHLRTFQPASMSRKRNRCSTKSRGRK